MRRMQVVLYAPGVGARIRPNDAIGSRCPAPAPDKLVGSRKSGISRRSVYFSLENSVCPPLIGRVAGRGRARMVLSPLKAGDPPVCLSSPLTCAARRLVAITHLNMSKNYSSQSYSPGSARPAKSTAGDTASKNKEKDEMVGLNDKFVKLIDKVKNLEDENAKLETKLKILKEYEVYKGQVDDIVKQEENELEQKVDNLLHDQEKLQVELDKNMEDKERTKQSYENELKKKDELEKDFIIAKKDLDNSHMETVHLSLELEDLVAKLDFLRSGFDEEIKELESQIQNKNVILPNNSKRCLDMQDIVENFKFQYAKRASHSRDEAERLYQRKMDAMVNKVAEKEEDVRDVKRNIAELERLIQRLIGELEALRRKEESLGKEIYDVQKESDMNLDKAREGIAQLEDALRLAKQKLAEQIREYQELMNIKLALDIEIATYRKLLEGEEQRINDFMLHSADF